MAHQREGSGNEYTLLHMYNTYLKHVTWNLDHLLCTLYYLMYIYGSLVAPQLQYDTMCIVSGQQWIPTLLRSQAGRVVTSHPKILILYFNNPKCKSGLSRGD